MESVLKNSYPWLWSTIHLILLWTCCLKGAIMKCMTPRKHSVSPINPKPETETLNPKPRALRRSVEI